MKKTIAILLVLVIAMAGVFAADATLNLETTVSAIDQMIVAQTSAVASDVWPAVANGETFSSTKSQTATVPVTDTSASGAAAQTVAKLWTRTNRRNAYSVKITATPLSFSTSVSGVGDDNEPTTTIYTEYIDYKISADSTIKFTTNGSTTVPQAVFYQNTGNPEGGGLTNGAEGIAINVKLVNGFDSVSAGTYIGSISFDYVVE